MNIKKEFVVFFFCLLLLPVSLLAVDSLSPSSVAELIIREEGYHLYHFTSTIDSRYQVVASFKGSDEQILRIPKVKEVFAAVKLNKDNSVLAVRVYHEQGSVSMTFDGGFQAAKFSSLQMGSEIIAGKPFLTLKGPNGTLVLKLNPEA